MIRNAPALGIAVAALSAGCSDGSRLEDGLQGVIELDERHLAFELAGRIASVEVRRGERVAAGARLAALDDTLERTRREASAAEAEAARAQLELLDAGHRPEEIAAAGARVRAAQANEARLEQALERQRWLLERGVATQATVDSLEQELRAAKATREALQQELAAMKRGARPPELAGASARSEAAAQSVALADERLLRHAIFAPIAGEVLDVHVEVGEMVGAAMPVVTIGQIDRPYVDVFVPVAELGGIALGDPASVRVDASAERYPAHVDWIARTTEFTPRYLFSERERPNLVVRVRLVLDEHDGAVHPGVPAFATIGTAP